MNMFGLNTHQSYLPLLATIVLFSYSVQSIRFELSHGKDARCFSEELIKNSMIVGNYSIVNHNKDQPLPPNHTIAVQVSTHGVTNAIIYRADDIQLGQFAFTAYETEQYLVCFMGTTEDYKVKLSIDFDIRTGVTTLGRPNIAKRSNIDRMVYEVQNLHETALSIQEEMSYLRHRNTEMLELNWITDNRMFLWIFVSYFVTFSVTGLQLWHLRTFFRKKKLI
ncbi:transmembrane emp24 domain-containing protein p24delta8-like [Vicia villosa]|uniref:transmembrane emp24 domain-containing protein p24delta8-like n=1 Tax=Vicia villosa TaxID=3911 RepID=UPI00273BB099|nr:transmembrane emp24 domain-containing protein p24delta8-like [Vicia villosa]